MSIIQTAHKIIRDSESSLRELMQQALERQNYADVAEVARIAEAISKILAQSKAAMVSDAKQRTIQISPPTNASKQEPTSMPKFKKKSSYPKFVRDEFNDRLVKIGWSKKNQKEYEHRVPYSSAMNFARYLVESVDHGKLFQVDEILPIADTEGNEIPSYQAYVTLAWLISIGLVEKKGRDGYVVAPSRLTMETFEASFSKLPGTEDLKGVRSS